MKPVVERFLRYVAVATDADPQSAKVPSSSGQLFLAKMLAEEMKSMGLSDVEVSDHGYVMGSLPAAAEKYPVIGLIAHLDTSDAVSGKNVRPRIVENYDGKDILLNPQEKIFLSTKDFPEILDHVGEDIIVTDGTTLLGADDKAGIASILTALEYLIDHPDIPHGTVRVAFTPDEEVGHGAALLDLERFGADFAYTIDAGPIGELCYENFNAASATIEIKGRSVHPGRAKGKMINAILIAQDFLAALPPKEIPACTEGYEGFFHVCSNVGTVENATIELIVRDHDSEHFEGRKALLQKIVAELNSRWGEGAVSLTMRDEYRNMAEVLQHSMHIVERAYKAMEMAGVTPCVKPVRGGTDGARLSFRGLPTPNVFAGGHNCHGRFEFLPVQSLEKSMEVVVGILTGTTV